MGGVFNTKRLVGTSHVHERNTGLRFNVQYPARSCEIGLIVSLLHYVVVCHCCIVHVKRSHREGAPSATSLARRRLMGC
ncbi:hypothetical protein GDO78_017014 [Eleutherodactylus coqui]|uniref:Uncharacterized protein n=1 Tax=Eleutherodactylus coqui TaxID=57060 RepID=A0A8J6E3K4_ELECQ|nr:hypothetical protein GDO78_017014 [Eleutherodactylus coqui]